MCALLLLFTCQSRTLQSNAPGRIFLDALPETTKNCAHCALDPKQYMSLWQSGQGGIGLSEEAATDIHPFYIFVSLGIQSTNWENTRVSFFQKLSEEKYQSCIDIYKLISFFRKSQIIADSTKTMLTICYVINATFEETQINL